MARRNKNRIRTNNRRTLRRSLPRFFSLMIMSMLGTMVFSGLMATAPDMLKTLDDHLDGAKVYDIRVLSDMGLDDGDIDAIRDLDSVAEAEGGCSLDLIAAWGEDDAVLRVYSLPEELNAVTLTAGRLPEAADEIAVEGNLLEKEGLKLGDSITLDSDSLINKSATIVGTVDSPLYYNNVMIDQNRGNTGIGSGKIKYYAYIPMENFDLDCYTVAYVTSRGAAETLTSSEDYLALIDKTTAALEELEAERCQARYDDIYAQAEAEVEEAEAALGMSLPDARAELETIEMPTWYLYDRTDYTTYTDYVDDSNSIRNLGKLFPIVFFAVAVLVSLISMNRMVEEDRLEIGTMKSLGFPEGMILSKYLRFSLTATLLGGLLGAALGLVIIPELIYNIYTILFTLPALTLTLQPFYTLLGFGLTVLCVCGTSVWTALQVLKEKPSELMRGKTPKGGHRILLERIPALWNRFRFSRKVTVRNLFRYKKRVLVTIGGIAGCTALMLTGFGVKDSIVDIPSLQYYDIYRFDGTAYISSGDAVDQASVLTEFLDHASITSAVTAQRRTAELEGIDGYMLVTDSADLKHIAEFTDAESGEPLALEPGKVIINEKLSAMTGLSAGDSITFTDVDNVSYTLPISGVAANYIEHFAYMDIETYESFGSSFSPNLVYFNTEELDEGEKDALAEELLAGDDVLSLTYRSTLIDNVDDSLKSLNSVVLILIVLSALLDFVVLYNLSNINITERKREIATLKVLGFYDGEVDGYINRETILLTILGIGLGLLLGIGLSHMVVSTIEIEKCRFVNELKPMSYVYTALMTAAFTAIVSLITHFNLRRIDMIDSLKSVE